MIKSDPLVTNSAVINNVDLISISRNGEKLKKREWTKIMNTKQALR